MIPDTTLSTPCRCCHGFCAAAKSYFAGQFKIGSLWNQPSRGSASNDVRFCMECGDSRKSIRWFMNCGVNSSAMRERFVATMSRSVVEILFLTFGILNTFSTSFGQTILFQELDQLFQQSQETVRYGVSENLYGYEARFWWDEKHFDNQTNSVFSEENSVSHCLFTSTSRRKRNRNLKAYPGPEPFTPLRWCEDARIDLVGSSTFFFCLVELSWKQVQAIKAFRGSRAPPGNRKILQCAITTYGNDFGDSQQHGGLEMSWIKKPLDSFWALYPVSLSYQQVTNLEFQRDGSTRIGRQSQTWLSVLLATLQLKLKTEEIVVWNRFHFVVAFELSPVRNARRVEGDFRSRIHYGVTRVDTGVSKTKCLWISTFAILRVWKSIIPKWMFRVA